MIDKITVLKTFGLSKLWYLLNFISLDEQEIKNLENNHELVEFKKKSLVVNEQNTINFTMEGLIPTPKELLEMTMDYIELLTLIMNMNYFELLHINMNYKTCNEL